MYPAIFSRTYPSKRIKEVLEAIQADGFEGAQMNLSSFGMDSLPTSLDNAALASGTAEAKRLGIAFAALSGTYNMAHPDPVTRRARRPGLLNVLKAAKAIGTPIVTLCTGSRDADNMWNAHPENTTRAAWSDMREELDWALAEAEALDLVLAIEPEPGNVVQDAKVARLLLDQVRSSHLKIILDAANLIGLEGLTRQGDIVAEAVDLLGPDVVLAHAKDIDTTGMVTSPGQGAIDLASFVAELASADFDGALIAHGFEAEDTAIASAAMAALCGRAS
ncbi:MAG: sugar phosphate isomerase/epimerase family protein [Spongiibacter marinus]|uniref:sugar phosphate isomerase/epimerase family protein n=1 Tax=Spongiibacter marinus TaxID=354246 RepID=UPI003C4F6D7A